MSNQEYRIDTHKIIESGIERVEFDPSKVKLSKDTDEIYNNEAERFMYYSYEDIEIAQKIFDLNYSLRWGKTKVEGSRGYNSNRNNVSGLHLFKRISTKLRKRPNKDEYSKVSLANHKKRAESLDRYDLDYAKEQFRLAVEEFNDWYVDEQTKRTVDAFSSLGNWKFDDEQEIEDIDIEVQKLSAKLKELKQKRFDLKCGLVIDYIKSDEEKIHTELKQPLIEEIIKQRGEGYKDSFFL